MSWKGKLWIAGVGAVVLAIAVAYGANPLVRSDEELHAWLLSRVPVGSDIERLKQIASEEDWEVWASWERGEHSDWAGIDGDTVMRVHLGHYYAPLRTDVSSFWAFDASAHLIDVKTEKYTDAP